MEVVADAVKVVSGAEPMTTNEVCGGLTRTAVLCAAQLRQSLRLHGGSPREWASHQQAAASGSKR
jgi:hypothetical protein